MAVFKDKKMYTHSAALVLILSVCGQTYSDSLSPKQEQDIIKFITYEINNFDVHNVDTLNNCLQKITALIKPYMKYGIKAWNVPVLEPLFLKNVKIAAGTGNSKLKAHFKDVLVYGLSNFKVNFLKTHPDDYSFDFGLHFPDLKILGYYNIDGHLLILNFKDHGPFTANLTQVDAVVKNRFQVANGILNLHEANTDFKFVTFKFHLDNLFKGSPIGESVNESLNQDVDVLLTELKPGFIRELNKIIVQTLQKGLQNLPLQKWQAAIT